ncbi:AlpA family transcriptional regulator [Aureimonas sp. AU20]|uniref:helix-turn-helix transcriptional regulator n=1 Tax=Aureimonas sp. AU20 TaxID=1349819 RepID=UPI000722FC4E|nr:helix-turn-helix domain-containing protein [Aureimonas sp. AU20]ALN75823.1 hypothetical protein M673_24020 [Aureimonas sp. AU20]
MSGSALILTRREAAELLGISPSTFDNWVRKGIIPKPLEGTKRWSRAAIERAVSGEPASRARVDDPEAIYAEWKRRQSQEPLSPSEIWMRDKGKHKRG